MEHILANRTKHQILHEANKSEVNLYRLVLLCNTYDAHIIREQSLDYSYTSQKVQTATYTNDQDIFFDFEESKSSEYEFHEHVVEVDSTESDSSDNDDCPLQSMKSDMLSKARLNPANRHIMIPQPKMEITVLQTKLDPSSTEESLQQESIDEILNGCVEWIRQFRVSDD
jgi:hypothetical protein